VCRKEVEAHPDDPELQLELGKLLLLNEDDAEAWEKETLPILRDVVRLLPESAEPRFWYGYALTVIAFDDRESELQIRRCLKLEPDHAYANIFFAGGLTDADESIVALHRALTVQPGNLLALVRLAGLLIGADRSDEARPYLLHALKTEPYAEHDSGVMNRFLSDELCGTGNASTLDKARSLLAQIDNPPPAEDL
jgi:thioredoxin-like negative regulator of GroEL